MPLDSLPTFVAATALLALAPGPDNIFVLTQSALHGRKSGIFIVLGLCTGLIVHTLAVASGVAVLLKTSAVAFTALKMLGAVYLAYLAYAALFKSKVSDLRSSSASSAVQRGKLYKRGIIMSISNPKLTIFFLAFLPQFASIEHGSLAPQLLFLGGVFIIISLLMFTAFAITAASLGNWLRSSPRSQLYLNRLAGVVFAGLALKLVTTSQQA